jgi:hypothetical protein
MAMMSKCGKIAVGMMLAAAVGSFAVSATGTTRDKTGTRQGQTTGAVSQLAVRPMVPKYASFAAERQGFEPWIRFKPYTAFPVPRLRPLGHLSDVQNCLIF